jgi:BioD-like phosphotransacetylase family protein
MLSNLDTKRLFIAATRMNDGKTTAALGLFASLKKHTPRIAFIKPVGQRFVEIEGAKVDEDSVLMERRHHLGIPLPEMSPVAVEPDFTRRYISGGVANEALVKRICKAFDRCAWEKDFVIIEGTGHAGVGSVFDLSNARVASTLQAKVILVTTGGIGRPIDEVALNKALFDAAGVEMIGVIVNKALPDKIEMVTDFCRRGFKRLGIELFGVIPAQPTLTQPTLEQVCEVLGGEFLNGTEQKQTRVARFIIGAMRPHHVMEQFEDGVLIITPGDRDDLVLAVLSTRALDPKDRRQVAGLVLTRDITPPRSIIELVQKTDIPVILAREGSYAVASKIHDMTVKTTASDTDKIDLIEQIFARHISVERILAKL